MNWLTLFTGIALVAATTTVQATQCQHPGNDQVRSVVRISDSNGVTASGVVIGDNLVLTAAHAINEDASVSIAADGAAKRAANVLAIDYSNDLALLSADTTGINTIRISASDLRKGEALWAAGYPNNTAMHVSKGTYRKPRGDRIEAHAWIDSGHSGGALFHCVRGVHRLAGIIHGFVAKRSKNGYVNTGRSVSISAASVTRFLNQSNVVAMAD